MAQAPFAEQCRTIDSIFTDILGHNADLRRIAGSLTAQTAMDVSDKFRLWKGYLNSAHPPESTLSLEVRLVSAPHLREELHDLLASLQDTLQDAMNIITGLRDNHTFLKEVYSPVDRTLEDFDLTEVVPVTTTETTEVEDLLGIASDTVGSLLRLVILVRKATLWDRHGTALQEQHEASRDSVGIDYVREIYPNLDRPESQWLLERLGRAVTIRRQFLRYFSQHKERPAADSSQQSHSLKPRSVEASTFDSSRSTRNNQSLHRDAQDVASYTRLTTPIAVAPEDARLYLPKLADVRKRWPKEDPRLGEQLEPLSQREKFFECPLCVKVISIKDERAWRRHVHQDLKSYVCCSGKEMCDLKMFGNQREWFNHELENHWRQWICIVCRQGPFDKPDSFDGHLQQEHPTVCISDQAVEALRTASQTPVKSISAKACPFCDDWNPESWKAGSESNKGKAKANLTQDGNVAVSIDNFRRHIAIHMEQLAIFAVPRGILDPRGAQGEIDRTHIAHPSQSSFASVIGTQDSSHQGGLTRMKFGLSEEYTQSEKDGPTSSPGDDEATAEMRTVRTSTPAELPGPSNPSQNPIPIQGSSEPSGSSQAQSSGLDISLPVEGGRGDSVAVPSTALSPNQDDWQSVDSQLGPPKTFSEPQSNNPSKPSDQSQAYIPKGQRDLQESPSRGSDLPQSSPSAQASNTPDDQRPANQYPSGGQCRHTRCHYCQVQAHRVSGSGTGGTGKSKTKSKVVWMWYCCQCRTQNSVATNDQCLY